MNDAYRVLYDIVLVILGLCMLCCLYRVIRGPKTADRLISVNMIGSIVIMLVCVLSFVLGEGFLTDVALLYAMLSFLAVVLLTKIFIGVKRSKKHLRQKEEKDE